MGSQWPGIRLQLFVEPQDIARIIDHPVLVRTLDVLDVLPAEDHGHTAIDTLCLEPSVADRLVGLGLAHHGRVNEQAVLELADEAAPLVAYALIVGEPHWSSL